MGSLGHSDTDMMVASAMIANDEETLCNVARWFTKEFQFVNDAYRLYSALHSLCGDFRSWYNSGPSQKYILRQIKAMDYSLADEDRRRTSYYGKASYTTKDENGDPIYAEEMDVGLLMLYGHILFVGKSYAVALSTSIGKLPSALNIIKAYIK